MSVAKVTEITSESPESFEDAIVQGMTRASRTLEGIKGAWVAEQKIVWSDDRISAYRVTMKVTFVLTD
jgi:dodecin